MKAKVKTKAQLLEMGFKHGPKVWRNGLKDEEETLEISTGKVDLFAGQQVEVLRVASLENGTVKVLVLDCEDSSEQEIELPQWMFQPELDLSKVPRALRYSIGRGDFVTFDYRKFNFPCDVRELEIKEVRSLAQWVLQVSK